MSERSDDGRDIREADARIGIGTLIGGLALFVALLALAYLTS
jgi:hypothetical protein